MLYLPPHPSFICGESLQMSGFTALHLFLALKHEYQAGCVGISEEQK